MKNKSHDTTTPLIHKVIKIASCPTLSGASELSYYIGRDEKDDIAFFIADNSGGGYFNKEWIAYKDVQAALTGRRVSSVPLRQLFRGKSLNTSGFLLAALIAEGLVTRISGKKTVYQLCPDEPFLAAMNELCTQNTDLTEQATALHKPKTDDAPVSPDTQTVSKRPSNRKTKQPRNTNS